MRADWLEKAIATRTSSLPGQLADWQAYHMQANVQSEGKPPMKIKPVRPIYKDKKGRLVFNLAADAANADWIRAARLARKAEAGDEEAAKKLKRLQMTPMYQITNDDEED